LYKLLLNSEYAKIVVFYQIEILIFHYSEQSVQICWFIYYYYCGLSFLKYFFF